MKEPCPCCKQTEHHKMSCETKDYNLEDFTAEFLKIELEHVQYALHDADRQVEDYRDALERAMQTIEALKKGEEV